LQVTGFEMRERGGPLVRATREIGAPGPTEVIVAVAGCGVCHTDLGFLYDGVPTRHPLPLVLGHEISGTVVEAGADFANLLGRSAIVPAVIPCGHCGLCRRSRGDICKEQVFPGNDVHGGFASHVVVPGRGLCVLPEGHPGGRDLAKLSVCADAVSTAYAAVRKSGVANGDFAVFVGAGGVGSFGVQIARALGARVLAIDVDDERLRTTAKLGAEWTINARGLSHKDVRARVREAAKSAGLAPVEWKIFETSGTAAGQESAFALLTHGATLGVVGYHAGDVTIRLSNLMAFAARAEGTWGCPPEVFPEILDLVLCGKVEIDPLIEFHPMSAINDVFERLHRGTLRTRPVLVPDFPKPKEMP
jgi:6-hydroxycyclohex-1-ene-1-carbonyl-CoA dehydrogenase